MCLDSFLVGLPMELEGGCSGLGVEVFDGRDRGGMEEEE